MSIEHSIDAKEMGNHLRKAREQKSLSREVCSEMIGISKTYLAEIERGAKVPKLETMVQIVNTLELSLDYVLQDSLLAGYRPKSSLLENRLNRLPDASKHQALGMLDALVEQLEKQAQ